MRFCDLLIKGKALFSEDERKRDVEHIMVWLSKKPRANFLAHLDEEASEAFINAYDSALNKLKANTPLQYITGYAYFDGASFKVTKDTLIPRFDTEVLLEFAKGIIRQRDGKVLDLCTGSGNLAICLAKLAKEVYASDISSKALEVARENAINHGVKVIFKEGSLFEPWVDEKFNLIVSNPPYIDAVGMTEIDERVQKEPHLALYGGHDGLDYYKEIIPTAKQALLAEGILAVEIGYNQGHLVSGLFEEYGYQNIVVLKDAQGLDRVVVGSL